MSRLRSLLLGALFVAFLPAIAFGQQTESTLKRELDTIYQQLLVDPSDAALNRRLIEIAVKLNDYDAAIGAVERLIFYDPSNVDLQIEAARYYLKIESYAAAAGYLKDAIALPGATGAQRQAAETLLAQAERATRPSPWAGFGQVGMRYQSNANHGSVALGLDEPLPFEGPVADWNTFALGTLALTQPVNENLVAEASISGYYADQQIVDRLDLGFAEAVAGPRIQSENGNASIKPYGLVQGITLGNDPYQFAYGAGIEGRLIFAEGWAIEPQFEYKQRDYYNSDDYPDATDLTGQLYTYAVNLNGPVRDNINVFTRVAFNQNDAAKAYQSYDQISASIAMEIGFSLLGMDNWRFAPFANATFTDYRGVSPTERYAGLTTKRKDELWTVGADLEIPLAERIAIGLAVEYTKNISNLDRNDYDNFKVVIGPQGRF